MILEDKVEAAQLPYQMSEHRGLQNIETGYDSETEPLSDVNVSLGKLKRLRS